MHVREKRHRLLVTGVSKVALPECKFLRMRRNTWLARSLASAGWSLFDSFPLVQYTMGFKHLILYDRKVCSVYLQRAMVSQSAYGVNYAVCFIQRFVNVIIFPGFLWSIVLVKCEEQIRKLLLINVLSCYLFFSALVWGLCFGKCMYICSALRMRNAIWEYCVYFRTLALLDLTCLTGCGMSLLLLARC